MLVFSKSLRIFPAVKLSLHTAAFTAIMSDRKPTIRTLRARAAVKTEVPVATVSGKIATKIKAQTKTKTVSVNEDVKIKKQPAKSKIKNEVEIKAEPHCEDELLEPPTAQRKNRKIKNKVEIKAEPHCEDELLEPPTAQRKNSASPRKRKQTEKGGLKGEKAVKVEGDKEITRDIEDIWQPENWRVVLDNILQMRKMHVAPVDSLGCEECPEKDINPEVFRYQTLISVMLSSQTRDEVTFAASQRLIEHGLTVDSILATPDEKIGELIYPAGFWKSKIKFIKNTTQILKDQYNGDIPRTLKELCKLPGVGPKMANIVMSVAWNDTVGIAVDTHVHRISNRLGWVPKPTKVPEETRKALEKWLPKDEWRPINLTLVGFGQTICRPVGPLCKKCLISDLCPFGRSVMSGKNKKKKPLK